MKIIYLNKEELNKKLDILSSLLCYIVKLIETNNIELAFDDGWSQIFIDHETKIKISLNSEYNRSCESCYFQIEDLKNKITYELK